LNPRGEKNLEIIGTRRRGLMKTMKEGGAMRGRMNAAMDEATDEATSMSGDMIAAMTAGHIQGDTRDFAYESIASCGGEMHRGFIIDRDFGIAHWVFF
jgi:hypothetical protein